MQSPAVVEIWTRPGRVEVAAAGDAEFTMTPSGMSASALVFVKDAVI